MTPTTMAASALLSLAIPMASLFIRDSTYWGIELNYDTRWSHPKSRIQVENNGAGVRRLSICVARVCGWE